MIKLIITFILGVIIGFLARPVDHYVYVGSEMMYDTDLVEDLNRNLMQLK